MLCKRLAFVAALATLPALAQVPSTPTLTLAAALKSIRANATMRFHGVRVDGSVESENWSGYAVTGTSFKYAKGSWIVPKVNCSKTPNSYAVFWVGLDGYNDTTVEQTGTLSICTGSTPSYYAWYEFVPNESIQIIGSLTAAPGNKFFGQITANGGGKFTIKITNEATGKSFTKSGTVSGAKSASAEWIAEAPTVGGAIAPLSDFGTISFGDDYTSISDTNWASDSAVTGPISDFGKNVNEIIMVNGSNVEKALPSKLTTDGSSFKDTWKSEGP